MVGGAVVEDAGASREGRDRRDERSRLVQDHDGGRDGDRDDRCDGDRVGDDRR